MGCRFMWDQGTIIRSPLSGNNSGQVVHTPGASVNEHYNLVPA